MNQPMQNVRWIGLALCASLSSFFWISECAAGPLVLRGTATVAFVEDGFDNGGTIRRLPFAAVVGDTFSFLLSIESQTPAPDYPSGFATFRSSIGGVQLQHNQLEVVVANDSEVSVLSLAVPRVADVMAIVGDTVLIRKSHQFAGTEYVGTTNMMGAPAFRIEVGFLEYVLKGVPDYPTILDDVSIPQDASTWQAFSHRELALRFDNLTFVGAYIDEVVIVPEPSALAVCSWCCLPWLGRRFAGRRPGHVTLISKRPRKEYAEPPARAR